MPIVDNPSLSRRLGKVFGTPGLLKVTSETLDRWRATALLAESLADLPEDLRTAFLAAERELSRRRLGHPR